ncbi:hypothetical protein NQ166_08400 [Microbacterium sp. zg.Y1090]|uniref:hypothetical protein n=1 Tax=Microbacterium TaxID=33882 RepID=UPI00214B6CA2|nr:MULTISPECIES: hypothetical protein [unclassified Microbacterium]MCR2811713.1 hypothetical protein [Microbacterium sp. zg.Y1084]MCR2818849.1 hypothetical protein [Microbacterium sp. zg.Y1090]MDL5486940.1 hypothetical protein [Microbacterium sp. zg-Y1211]WIM27162.1 hypothetical protein QNO26_08210 [Microbacterium sp. zg-Y1090]
MPPRDTRPRPPRQALPDLPPRLTAGTALGRRSDVSQTRLEGLTADVDAAHARLVECVLAASAVGRLDLTGATLIDVAIEDLRATTVAAVSGTWRSVAVTGGRIGTLDLSRAQVDAVEVRGARIDYLALGQAVVADVLIADCVIGSLDLPGASLERVRFEDSRADDVDTREMRATDLDLRGLQALGYTDPAALRGATLSAHQASALAESFAAALGVQVRD